MSVERLLVWAVAVVCCVGSVLVDGGVPRPESSVFALGLGALVALPLVVVFGRFLLSFGPANRGWR
jgi:hypothetical protein